MSREEAFSGVRPSANHIKVWGCRALIYMAPESLPSHVRNNKLMDRAKECIFVGYVEGSTSQWLFWVPDMRRVVKSHRAVFRENEPGGSIYTAAPSPNSAPPRRPVGRPRAIPITEEVPEDITMAGGDLCTDDTTPITLTLILDAIDDVKDVKEISRPPSPSPDPVPPAREHGPILRDDTIRTEAQRVSNIQRPLLHDIDTTANPFAKRLLSPDLELLSSKRTKLNIAAMAPVAIPTPDSTKAALGDAIWGSAWRESMDRELEALSANGTFEEVHAPPAANIIRSR